MIGAEEIFADVMIKLKHHLYIVKEIEPRVKSGVERVLKKSFHLSKGNVKNE